MYDDIILEVPFKCECGKKLTCFQTKELDNLLNKYTITKNKELKKELSHWELTEKNKLLEKEKKELEIPLFKTIVDGEKIIKDITDTLYGITYCSKCDKFIHIKITFIKGKLDSIEKIKE